MGLKVVRYWNDDVLVRTDDVLRDIWAHLAAPHPSPLPACGERELGGQGEAGGGSP